MSIGQLWNNNGTLSISTTCSYCNYFCCIEDVCNCYSPDGMWTLSIRVTAPNNEVTTLYVMTIFAHVLHADTITMIHYHHRD